MNMQPSSATIDLMNQKYSILGRHADAAMLGAQAAMTNARNEAALTARRQDLMGAQAGESQQRGGLYGAEAGKTGVEAQWLPSVYRSNIGLTNAQARGPIPARRSSRMRRTPASMVARTLATSTMLTVTVC